MADRVGQQFGNYRLLRLLGKGGFAEVYLSEHIHLKTQAAIKLLTAELTGKEMAQFQEEARLIARLEHDHIVPILEFGFEDKIPFLVMKHAPGGTLRKRYPKGTQVPLSTVISYLKQIAPALQYAHFRKHIHRDVKPENILLGPNDKIWLSDFGIAALAHNTSSLNTQGYSGTAIYSAPEQIQGKPRPASDQYALGIVVYEWLTGTPPFSGGVAHIIHEHLYTSPPSLQDRDSSISPQIDQIVLQALAKKPEQRFKSVSAFAKELERVYLAEQSPISMPTIRKATAGTLLHSYEVPWGSVYSFSWAQNRPRFATGNADGKIEAWDFTTGSLFSKKVEGQIAHVSWSPDGHNLACLYWNKDEATTKLQLWNVEAGICFATYSKAWEPLIWSPDGTRIAFRSYKRTPQEHYGQHFHQDSFSFKYWMDSDYENQMFQIWDIDRGAMTALSTFKDSTGEPRTLKYASEHNLKAYERPGPVWSPDNKYIALSPQAVSGSTWVIPVYEIATGNFIRDYSLQSPRKPSGLKGSIGWLLTRGNITWSPDATHIAYRAHYGLSGYEISDELGESLRIKRYLQHQTIHVWAVATQSEITPPQYPIPSLTWSPDGSYVAFPSSRRINLTEDGSRVDITPVVEIWDVATKHKQLEAYEGHTEPIIALAWSPVNKHVASASYDGNIHVWDAHSAQCKLILETHINITSRATEPVMLWSSNGTQLAFISSSGLIQIWQVI